MPHFSDDRWYFDEEDDEHQMDDDFEGDYFDENPYYWHESPDHTPKRNPFFIHEKMEQLNQRRKLGVYEWRGSWNDSPGEKL